MACTAWGLHCNASSLTFPSHTVIGWHVQTMMNVRETFRNHQWGEEMKRMQKASRRREALDKCVTTSTYCWQMHCILSLACCCRANAAAAKWTAEERTAAAKSRSPLKNSVSTLEGKRQSFGLGVQQQAQNDGDAGADQAPSVV